MDEFKRRSIKYYDEDGGPKPKIFGRRVARRQVKTDGWDEWSDFLYNANEQPPNIWDEEEDYGLGWWDPSEYFYPNRPKF